MQRALAAYLQAEGWLARAAADTESKERGVDLYLERAGRCLAVEVKGFPSTVYDHGPRAGLPKPTQPATQARQWFSHALLSMMLLRDKHPNDGVALCLPEFPTYIKLLQRTGPSLEQLGFGVYLVAQDGSVKTQLPPL